MSICRSSVRLPNGVFAPYTSIPTNILFFDRTRKTDKLWFYEHTLPEGRKNYTKTNPIQYEEFADLIAWWHKREEGERAWCWDFASAHQSALTAAQPHWDAAEKARKKAQKSGNKADEEAARTAQAEGDNIYWPLFNLDQKNPSAQETVAHQSPAKIVASLSSKVRELDDIIKNISSLLEQEP